MSFNLTEEYLNIVNGLKAARNLPENTTDLLLEYVKPISRSELSNHFSAPMIWIGLYIASASAVCILAMVADLLHGLRNRKLWFPCKYFRVNAFFLTVIAVAMKLPVDLTGTMMGRLDKATKLGSMAFMCTMMANLLPCLATMGNNDLLSNLTALSVLVITMVVNVCIQMQTGVLSTYIYFYVDLQGEWYPQITTKLNINILACIYVVFLVMLLIVHVCSSVAILKSKKIIESKYQKGHDRALEELGEPSPGKLLKVEKLQNHVSNHWIMAGSGSPQFITSCFHTTSASGVICLLVAVTHTGTMYYNLSDLDYEYGSDRLITWSNLLRYCDSDYGWTMMIILIVQFIGIMIGAIAPFSRCFATLSFKVSPKIISNHFKVCKVGHYWAHKLYDWKHTSIRLPFRSRTLEVVIETLKRIIFDLCIRFQNGVVVVCKVVALIPVLFMICFHGIKWLLKPVISSLRKKFEKLEGNNEKFEKLGGNNDLRPYVLQLEKEMELGARTLKGLTKSVNKMIQKGSRNQPNNLMKLILGKSTSHFLGVKTFDQIDDHDVDCWRLPVITLTTIAVSLPKIEKEEVDSLLESVREGLEYVTVVEKSLNGKDDHVSFQKVADTLWQEIRFDKKWLGNKLQDPAFQEKTTKQIVEWFRDEAKKEVYSEHIIKDDTGGEDMLFVGFTGYSCCCTGGEKYDLIRRSMCAKSMYRITETALLTYHANTDATVDQKELFNSLSSLIADIIAACLTNLPHAITMKCHTSVIEEREDGVKGAAQLLGETTEIIKILQDRDIPDMNSSDLPFIKNWRANLGNP